MAGRGKVASGKAKQPAHLLERVCDGCEKKIMSDQLLTVLVWDMAAGSKRYRAYHRTCYK